MFPTRPNRINLPPSVALPLLLPSTGTAARNITNPERHPMNTKPNTLKFRSSRLGISLVTTALTAISLLTASAADWTGTNSTDWNNAVNWSGGAVPTGQNAIINNGSSGNIATISADLSVTPNDIDVRNGSRLDHTAGVAGTSGGAWMFVGQDNSAGTYNLADTTTNGAGITGFAQGTGSLNATGNLLVGAYGDNRTGTVRVNTQGTLAVTGELYIGDSQNSTANFLLESGTMTVNNKIFIGNNQGIGTLSMSGGTLTKTGGDEMFVGRDQGTGTITQSGGTVTLNHNLYVGQSSSSTGIYNISGSAFLNIGRDFVIGRENGNGTLNMTGGTITKTGDEKFLVGHNNATGTVVQSAGTISANNELYIGNENTNASGTYTLSGTGALTVSNEVVVGRESGTGILNVNGGTITTSGNGNMYIGRRNGTGTLNQSNGVIIVNKEFGVGTRDDNKIGTGTYNLSGGSLTASNNIFIGKEQGSSGTMSMTGGTMSTSDKLQIGHNQATGVLTQSGGTVNVQNEVYIGNENNASSVGTYTLSGTGALNVGNEVIVGRDNGTGTLNLNGGTVTATKISGGNGSATVNFNGGVLKAKRDEANLIENLDTANVQSNGLKINSNGFNVASSQVFTGPGGLEKLGSGSLTLSGASTYNGTTTVTMGTLNLNNTGGQALGSTGSVSVASGATLLISASNQVNDGGSVTLSGGTIARATGVSETFQNLILTESSFLNFGTTESAGSFNFGTFTPTDTKVLTFLNFQINNSVSFSAASPLSMTFFAAGSGSLGLQGTMTGLSTFTITAIPEPSTVVAALGLSALLGWPVIRRRMRRRGRN